MQALDERLHLGPGLESPAARELDQLDCASAPIVAQLGQQLAHLVDADLALEHALQVHCGNRLVRREQRGFEDALGFSAIGHGQA